MRRPARLALLLAVGAAGAAIALAGALPEGFHAVGEVAGAPERFAGREVHVKAVVAEAAIERHEGWARFTITDTTRDLAVEYHGGLPEALAAGRTVVVSGVLEARPSGPVLVAHAIQGGCASKYEPAATGQDAPAAGGMA